MVMGTTILKQLNALEVFGGLKLTWRWKVQQKQVRGTSFIITAELVNEGNPWGTIVVGEVSWNLMKSCDGEG